MDTTGSYRYLSVQCTHDPVRPQGGNIEVIDIITIIQHALIGSIAMHDVPIKHDSKYVDALYEFMYIDAI